MYASLSIITLEPGKDEELRRLSLDTGVPILRRQPGFRGCQAIHLGRESWIISTYWDNEDHCRAGVAAMNEAVRERYGPILAALDRRFGEVEYVEDIAGAAKVTVLYGPPTEAAEFERYYFERHLPLASTLQNLRKTEIAKVVASPGQAAPPYYRIAELWFDSSDTLQEALGSAAGQAVAADLANFASGGATILVTSLS